MNLHEPLWQLADSAFPAGGFAHSGRARSGLAMRRGADGRRAPRFRPRRTLAGRARHLLPLAVGGTRRAGAACRARRALSRVPDQCRREPCEHRAGARVAGNLRPRLAGRRACARSTPRARQLRGHHAPIAGAVLAALDVPLDERPAAAPLSRDAGRALRRRQARHRRPVRRAAAAGRVRAPMSTTCSPRCSPLRDPDIAQTAPILDLLQAGHDRLYSRLFQS